MIIEIRYTFTPKNSEAIKSFTYFFVKGDDLTAAKSKAKTYFKKFCTELGWRPRQVKLDHIEKIQNAENYCPEFIVVSKSELPPARKRRSKAPTHSPRVSRTPSRSRTSKKKSV